MIYLLTGDPYRVEEAFRKLTGELLTPSLQDFNLDTVEGRSLEAIRFLEIGRLVPVLASHRVLVVRRADEIRKGELDRLEADLADLARMSQLIFLAEKLDRRLRFWQKAGELGRWTDFPPLSFRDAPRWIGEECRRKGIKIRPEAVAWLIERLGQESGLIAQAIEKVLLLKGNGGEVGVKELEETIQSFPLQRVFDLVDAIGSRELKKALGLFRQISLAGESPVGILALISRHFRILFKVKETGSGAPPYFLKKYQAQAEGFDRRSLRGAVDQIFRTDWNLKSSKLSQELLMERLIWNLCSA